MPAAAPQPHLVRRAKPDNARGQIMALVARDAVEDVFPPESEGVTKARILEYYRYNAFGSVTVLPVYDRDDSSYSHVESTGAYSHTADDIPGSGSRSDWDLIENTPLDLSDNNTLMHNRRTGSGHAAAGESYGRAGAWGNEMVAEQTRWASLVGSSFALRQSTSSSTAVVSLSRRSLAAVITAGCGAGVSEPPGIEFAGGPSNSPQSADGCVWLRRRLLYHVETTVRLEFMHKDDKRTIDHYDENGQAVPIADVNRRITATELVYGVVVRRLNSDPAFAANLAAQFFNVGTRVHGDMMAIAEAVVGLPEMPNVKCQAGCKPFHFVNIEYDYSAPAWSAVVRKSEHRDDRGTVKATTLQVVFIAEFSLNRKATLFYGCVPDLWFVPGKAWGARRSPGLPKPVG